MQEFEVVVDFGGMVVFDPDALHRFYGGIGQGENLYQRLITTDDGEKVVERGVVVPIIGINDSLYRVVVRLADEATVVPADLIVVENAVFPLEVRGRIVIADLAVLREWHPEAGWQDIDRPTGFYAVAVNGFRRIEAGTVVAFGFELVFTPVAALPQWTASLTKDMQVLSLGD